jgi:hypothetical protein
MLIKQSLHVSHSKIFVLFLARNDAIESGLRKSFTGLNACLLTDWKEEVAGWWMPKNALC